jgi:hypothetical protein
MRVIKEPGVIRKLLSEFGGRSWLLVVVFVMLCLGTATYLEAARPEFTPDHWLKAIQWCVYAIALVVGKRVVEEVGAAFGKNGGP